MFWLWLKGKHGTGGSISFNNFPFAILFSCFPAVTHDLDVVVKGNLISSDISDYASTTVSRIFIKCEFTWHRFSDGCPGLCSGHGRCTLEQSGWRCVCQTGWSGPGCSVVMETDCSDGTDNDGGDISNIIYHFQSFFLSLFCLFYFCVSGGLSITSFCLFSCQGISLHTFMLSQCCWDSCRVLLVIIILNMYFYGCSCVLVGTVLVCILEYLL